MKDHEIAIIVNNLKLCAQVYHDSQQLRERIAHIVVDALKSAPVNSPLKEQIISRHESLIKCPECGESVIGGCSPGMSCY